MKKSTYILTLLAVVLFSSCQGFNKLMNNPDQSYKYEAAKQYFAQGKYTKAETLLNDIIVVLKGSDKGEESLYMLGMSYYNDDDMTMAHETFSQYVTTYPRGTFIELARFYSGKALYLFSPEARLDQSGTYNAISELQAFVELFPNSEKREEAQFMIFDLQDKLVEKELYSARLYYNMGNYLGNNYQACVITAQNALNDFPYSEHREELAYLVMRAKYDMAANSVVSKRVERYRDAQDECYAFRNEFPESKYLKEANEMLEKTEKALANVSDDE